MMNSGTDVENFIGRHPNSCIFEQGLNWIKKKQSKRLEITKRRFKKKVYCSSRCI